MINKERIPCPQEEKRCCSYKISKLEMAWHRLWFELLRQKGFVNNIIDIVNPQLLFRNPVHIRHMHVLCILDYIHTRSWRTDCLTCAMISQPPSTTTTFTISPSTTTTSTPTDQPTSPAYYYFYCFYYIFNCYYNSYWAPIGLPSPDHIDRASFYRLITSSPVHRIVVPLCYATIALYRALASSPIPASHRWVLKLSILSQYHTHWVVMHVSKLAEIKIEIKINDIYLNITHIGMGRFVMHVSRLTTW